MAAVTAAVVGTAVAVKSSIDAKKARKEAAAGVERAGIESAEQLRTATRAGEQDVLAAQQEAAVRSALGATEAERRISPFLRPGERAFRSAKGQILSGAPIGGALGEAIRRASLSGVDPRVFATEGIEGELIRQAMIAESGVTPDFNQQLLASGLEGIQAAGDIGGIRGRGLESLADIAGATAAQRASLLVGAAPQFQTLSQGANEARLLGQVAGGTARRSQIETLSELAGRVL